MSFVVSVYGKNAFKEFLLPAIDNADSTITLYKNVFGLKQDLTIPLEIINASWRFSKNNKYRLEKGSRDYFEQDIHDGDILQLTLRYGAQLSFLVKQTDNTFVVYRKYVIPEQRNITIGSTPDNTICYSLLQLVSKEHAVIEKKGGECTIYDRSANGVFINDVRARKQQRLHYGDRINIIGLRMVFLAGILAIDWSAENLKINERLLPLLGKDELNRIATASTAGRQLLKEHTFFHRVPRNMESLDTEPVEIEAPPAPVRMQTKPLIYTIGPSLTMALPMLLGCSLALIASRKSGMGSSAFMYTGLITAVSSAIIGTVWAVGNLRQQRKANEEVEKKRNFAYGEYLSERAISLKESYSKNRTIMLNRYPSALSCSLYDSESLLLWNRNATHDDFLYQRIGVGTLPFQVPISVPKARFTVDKDPLFERPEQIRKQFSKLQEVPVGIDLAAQQLIGIIGGDGKRGAYQVAKTLITQIAANNCYTDVKIAVVYDRENENETENLNCVKWLPHVWSEDKKVRYVADTKAAAGDVFFEITKILRKRAEDADENKAKQTIPKPHYVLFITRPELFEGEMIAKYVFSPHSAYGITTFLLVESYEDLPNSCEYIIQNDRRFTGIYSVSRDSRDQYALQLDDIEKARLDAFARRLSRIEVSEVETGGEIPGSLTFFEMCGVEHPNELNVLSRWKKNRTYDSMKAQIGVKTGGMPCFLDVHEKYHGPHGLVAGTTGSGKSETLQTYILALASNFSPDDIGFFIIDFKGGGMANLFSDLPHLMGQISNLSGNQVRRAMISIKSENQRRQRLFSENGVNKIDQYTQLYKEKKVQIPIPHMFIIIDEFAELKREEPDFMQELISVSQVGRSLGVHLILATQKPSGTVSDDIRSNSRFRLCLRVQDRQDSMDMLHKPDAAYITQAGRCYLQVGNDELYEQFQSGWSGAAYNASRDSHKTNIASMLDLTGKTTLTGNRQDHKKKDKLEEGEKITQLDAVVQHLQMVAQQNGYDRKFMLWMPLLPKVLYLHQLPGYSERSFQNGAWPEEDKAWTLSALIGLCDDPVNQTQIPLEINFAENGHHALCGTVVTGKSTFLQSLLYSLVSRYTPDHVNIYAIDCSTHMLGPFKGLAHVGGLLYDNDLEKISKLFTMLRMMMEERKKLFQGGSYAQYVQVHGLILPAVVVAIDQYANFRDKTKDEFDSMILQLSRDGANYGIYLFLTAAGFSHMEIPKRIADNMRVVLSLEMSDKYQYSEVMRASHIDVQPEPGVKGRGLAWMDKALLEFQTALACEAEDDFNRGEKIHAVCEEMNAAWNGKSARKIPEIPEKPTILSYLELEEVQTLCGDTRHLPIGYNRENASAYGLDLSRNFSYIISGKARTGKSNLLKLLMIMASRKGGHLCAVDTSDTLRSTAEEVNADFVADDKALYTYLEKLVPVFRERNLIKREAVAEGLEDEEIYDRICREEPYYIFIDSLPDFVKMVTKPSEGTGDMKGFMELISDKGSLHHVYFFSAINPDLSLEVTGIKLYENMVRDKKGIHLGGNVAAQRIFSFDSIPFAEQGKAQKPGIGYLAGDDSPDAPDKVVIPLVRKREKNL